MLRPAGAGLAGGAALLVAACGGSHSSSTPAGTSRPPASPFPTPDVDILNHLLDLEHMAIAAYTAGIPLLAPSVRKAGAAVPHQELSHAGELSGPDHAGRRAGRTRPGATTRSVIRAPRRTCLRLLHEVERAQIAAYLARHPESPLGIDPRGAGGGARQTTPSTSRCCASRLGQPAVPVGVRHRARVSDRGPRTSATGTSATSAGGAVAGAARAVAGLWVDRRSRAGAPRRRGAPPADRRRSCSGDPGGRAAARVLLPAGAQSADARAGPEPVITPSAGPRARPTSRAVSAELEELGQLAAGRRPDGVTATPMASSSPHHVGAASRRCTPTPGLPAAARASRMSPRAPTTRRLRSCRRAPGRGTCAVEIMARGPALSGAGDVCCTPGNR